MDFNNPSNSVRTVSVMFWLSSKDHVEQILEAGYLDESEIDFVKSLLPEIENDRIREDLEEYLESLMIL